MSDTKTPSWVVPLAAFAGLGTMAATTAALIFLGREHRAVPNTPAPVEQMPAVAPPLRWFGGPSRDNIDALAFMFATENDDASPLVWTLQALAANNFARQLGRTHKQITSIADMLRSGIDKSTKPYKRLYNLGWGLQYDKIRKITRFAGTTRGLKPLSVTWPKFELAERLLVNRVKFDELRGRRGESMPPSSEWMRINSFLQYENFGEIVQRQAGDGAEKDPNVVVASWGTSRLISSVEGLRFFAVGA